MTEPAKGLLLLGAVCLAAFLAAFVLVFGVLRHGNHPLELTAEERAGPRHQKTFQSEIHLRIVSHEELESQTPVKSVTALSIISKNPCEIMIPEGWTIEFDSSTGRARWMDRGQEDVLAHEILHCLRGSWHDDWSKINAARR